jgi:hypothetical protein
MRNDVGTFVETSQSAMILHARHALSLNYVQLYRHFISSL